MTRFTKTLAVLLLLSNLTHASEQDSTLTFRLGEIEVTGTQPSSLTTSIDYNTMQQAALTRASDALQWLPGVIITEASSRAESNFLLRGFNQSSIPVYVDGIPVYIPYDGLVDLYRMQTGGFAKIEVSHTQPSLVMGGNSMAGAINLVSMKPQKTFELEVHGNTLGNAYINVGAKVKSWYFQLHTAGLWRCDFHLPTSYTDNSDYTDGNKRNHSAQENYQLGAKVGYAPNTKDEYAIGYYMIRSQKDIPPYLGTNGRARFWRYKDWDMDQLYLQGTKELTSGLQANAKLYYNRAFNVLNAFDDQSYSTQNSKQSFNSTYNDYTLGAQAYLDWKWLANQQLRWGVNYKNDVHRQHDNNDPVATQAEGTLSFAVEDKWQVLPSLSLSAGLGYFMHRGYEIELYEKQGKGKEMAMVNYPTASDNFLNYHVGAQWQFVPGHQLRFNYAHNGRFASLKDRYSYKAGKALPNPFLKTERSHNIDVDYEGRWKNLNWYAGVYRYMLNNVIQEVTGVDASDPKIWQLQNQGKATFTGAELGINYQYKRWKVGGNYSFIHQRNNDNPEIHFIHSPQHKLHLMTDIPLPLEIQAQINLTALSSVYTSTDGKEQLPGFGVCNVSLRRTIAWFDIALGSTNVFDKYYAYSEGFPMEGRRIYLSLTYRLNK